MIVSMATHFFDAGIPGTTQSEALDFISSVLQSSTEYSIVAARPDGQIPLWNDGARRLYGYQPEEVIGRANWDILFTAQDVRAGKPRHIGAAAFRDGKWEGLVKPVGKNDRRFTTRMVVTPRRSGSGRPVGFVLICKDTSAEIQAAQSEEKFRGLLESVPGAMLLFLAEIWACLQEKGQS
jgi:PAS domain S-box-containing protein